MSATKTDNRNVAIPSDLPEEKYREFWAASRPLDAAPHGDRAGRTVVLFTQHRVYRLAPAEAVALAAQLRRAAQPERVCGSCADDLRQEADADRGAAEHDAQDHAGREPHPDAGF